MKRLFKLASRAKMFITVIIDTVTVWVSSFFAVSLINAQSSLLDAVIPSVLASGLAVLVYRKVGLYNSVIRFMADEVFSGVITATLITTATYTTLCYLFDVGLATQSIIVFASTMFFLSSSFRLGAKYLIINHQDTSKQAVLIYGAGSAGRQLMSALHVGDQYYPVAFIDDDVALENKVVHGRPVYAADKIEHLIQEKQITKILLAIPSASHLQRKHVLDKLEPLQIEVKTIAAVSEIISGKVQISELQDINIEDLLGRETVAPNQQLMMDCIEGKVVLVTGAGGSIGSELCRQIVKYKPRRLVLFDISEFGLYTVSSELKGITDLSNKIEIVSMLGSVLDRTLLKHMFTKFGVNTVYHAAAYKHVPIVENNVVEGVKNNILGTKTCAEEAMLAQIENFVLISTDKAVRPTNFMGASKRVAELIVQACAKTSERTRFSIVRFGNVLGSSGSVVPLFKKQILAGGPVTVTHKDITRYFMTIPEAAQLVIQAGALAKGGDVFVLDMGAPVKIADLAKRIIHLMGYEACDLLSFKRGKIAIEYTGLRSGEKLYEELLIGEDVEGTIHPRIMAANEIFVESNALTKTLQRLQTSFDELDCQSVKKTLQSLPIGFNHNDIDDNIHRVDADRPMPNKIVSMSK